MPGCDPSSLRQIDPAEQVADTDAIGEPCGGEPLKTTIELPVMSRNTTSPVFVADCGRSNGPPVTPTCKGVSFPG
jgi:hypothetical protein